MSDHQSSADGARAGGRDSEPSAEWARAVGVKARRTLKARRWAGREVWFGLGVAGIIGWAVTIPMILMTGLGVWLDRTVPVPFSWTLTMLAVGIVLGCVDAWFWMSSERRIIDRWSRNGEPQAGREPMKGRQRH
jgi:ATP synthase protein I